ncbi:MAG: serine hydrolase family protein [Candidatus Aenigmarchaeota archaeon]|nr:serine hydrolase family protein [Candidatus Aenigmarchaeota archaeon]
MKRVLIVHGFQGRPDTGWKLWIKDKLEEKGFEVFAPRMPDPDYPKAEDWVSCLSAIVGKPDSDTYFIGHSLGCLAILRYLDALKKGQHIGGAVLVAAPADNRGYKYIENFFKKPLDWERVKAVCANFVVIHSEDDKIVPIDHAFTYQKNLGAEAVIVNGMGHFSSDEGITEAPVILDALLGMVR